jgi:hypothetical protein
MTVMDAAEAAKTSKVQAAYEVGAEVRDFAQAHNLTVDMDLVESRLSELAGGAHEGTYIQACAKIANRWTVKRFALNPELTVREASLGKEAARTSVIVQVDEKPEPEAPQPHPFERGDEDSRRCRHCGGGTMTRLHRDFRA